MRCQVSNRYCLRLFQYVWHARNITHGALLLAINCVGALMAARLYVFTWHSLCSSKKDQHHNLLQEYDWHC
jgi:hypothetical protein